MRTPTAPPVRSGGLRADPWTFWQMCIRDSISRTALLIRHGLIYMVLIFIAEYVTGTWLTGAGICPWDYSRWPDSIDGVIRLNFAPLWFGTGLLFEQITKNNSRS